jgi:ribosome-binding factor A
LDRIKKTEIDLKREISFIINSKLKDPRIGFVTVTDVKLSPDFHYLDVFVSIMGEETNIGKSMEGLKHCDGFIKKNLKERFRLRAMPDIRFIHDIAISHGIKINEILENLKNKTD